MRISFDFDDTLICYQSSVPSEKNRIPWVLRRWLTEPLRLGSVELIRALQAHGWEVWVYTTSGRSRWLVSCWLWFYGIRVAGVINDRVYQKYLQRHRIHDYPSKNARWFGMDLHVDDSQGVWQEGQQYGFNVHVVSLTDTHWCRGVLAAADRVMAAADEPNL